MNNVTRSALREMTSPVRHDFQRTQSKVGDLSVPQRTNFCEGF